jgi:hypothetical protein
MEVFLMAQVLVRDISSKTVEILKKRARQNRRSLQGELKTIMEEAAGASSHSNLKAFLDKAEMIRRRTAGRKQTDSATLIRKARSKR